MDNLTTRRQFFKKAGILGATVALGGLAGPLLKGSTNAFAADSVESISEILNLALTAEQLATTFYFTGIHSHLMSVTDKSNKPYLQAALYAENFHAQLLSGAGGTSLVASNPQFYFPADTFRKADTFLSVLDALEVAFIEAYLAAVYQFSIQNRPDLAQLAAEIMGVEAEHRVLGRNIAGATVPNNFILEKANGTSVAVVAQALIPFLSANNFNGTSSDPIILPTQDQIQAAVGNNIGVNPNS